MVDANVTVPSNSGRAAAAVDDAQLLEGTRRLGREEGIFAAPEAGALVAAAEQLLESGQITKGDRAALFLTGTGVKYGECF